MTYDPAILQVVACWALLGRVPALAKEADHGKSRI